MDARRFTDDPGALEMLSRLDRLARRHDADWHGRRVCWRVIGDGSPLVLLHGGHGSWLHWVRNIESLAERHAVWVPDMPGYGDSGDVRPPATGEDVLQPLVAALRDTLDRRIGADAPIGLVGFSFGGLVAARLAAQRPGVSRLALIGPAGHGGPRPDMPELLKWRNCEGEERRRRLRRNLDALMLADPAHRADPLALAVHQAASESTRFHSRTSSTSGGLAQALDAYAGPVLLLWGEHDVTVQARPTAERLAGEQARREWCVVPGAGHWLQFERPREVNRLLGHWFQPGRREA